MREVDGRANGWIGLRCAGMCLEISRSCTWKSDSPAEENDSDDLSTPLSPVKAEIQRKPGWKAMPYIIGNETFERLAAFGLVANFMVYLMREYHMDQVQAANVINIWSGLCNLCPLIGAFISDAYAGRFRTIAVGSFASLLGMVTMTLTAWIPQLQPPPCPAGLPPWQCKGPTGGQLAVLATGLGLLVVGAAGIRACSIPFGVDQFDQSTEEGQKGISSYFTWYYLTLTAVIIVTQTLIVYIQDTYSWVIGFGIPTALMLSALVFFFVGSRIYVHVKPEGSVFTGIIQVVVAAYRKRRLELPPRGSDVVVAADLYDPPVAKDSAFQSKLPLTNQFRCLNKAAIVIENDLHGDGRPRDRWSLCSIQQVEELKCLLKIGPVWFSGMVCLISVFHQVTFVVSQALKMDRHLGPRFQIPAGSMIVITMITVTIWLPIYNHLLVPALRRVTGVKGAITLLQRMGLGMVFSILSMVVAGLVEKDRRALANAHPNALGIAPMSALWLVPQLVLLGLCEAFNMLGQIEFYNQQVPDQMRSVGNALYFCSLAGSSYLCTLMVNIVHRVTGGHGRPDWLTADINAGRLDYFYYFVAAMGALNFIYFLYCSRRYQYKGSVELDRETRLDF